MRWPGAGAPQGAAARAADDAWGAVLPPARFGERCWTQRELRMVFGCGRLAAWASVGCGGAPRAAIGGQSTVPRTAGAGVGESVLV